MTHTRGVPHINTDRNWYEHISWISGLVPNMSSNERWKLWIQTGGAVWVPSDALRGNNWWHQSTEREESDKETTIQTRPTILRKLALRKSKIKGMCSNLQYSLEPKLVKVFVLLYWRAIWAQYLLSAFRNFCQLSALSRNIRWHSTWKFSD